jgi:type II secretory pathway pseudopilin PulG
MIELLVVIAIMIVLAGLTVSGVVRFIDTGPRLATRSNLKNLKRVVDAQWKEVADKARTDKVNSADPNVRASHVNDKLAQAFPQTFAEALSPPNGVGAWSAYTTYLGGLGVTAAKCPTTPTAAEQAICLMMALQMGPKNTNVTPESLGVTAAKLVPCTLKDGTVIQAYGIVDAWGTPMQFSRTGALPPAPPYVITATGKDKQTYTTSDF